MNIDPQVTQQTRQTVEILYACGRNGDIPGVLATLDEDVMVHEPPLLPYAGTHHGIDGFLHVLGKITQSHMDFSRLVIERMVVEGERSFAVLKVPALKGGTALFAAEMVVRNGKVVDIWLYFHDPASITVHAPIEVPA